MDELNLSIERSNRTEGHVADFNIDEKVNTKTKSRKKRKKEKVKNTVPSIQRAWKVGYTAAQSNLPESRNPFLIDTNEHIAWSEGWWSGFYDEPLQQGLAVVAS